MCFSDSFFLLTSIKGQNTYPDRAKNFWKFAKKRRKIIECTIIF